MISPMWLGLVRASLQQPASAVRDREMCGMYSAYNHHGLQPARPMEGNPAMPPTSDEHLPACPTSH